ncbi:MAG: HAD family hydrolase [Bacteroidota bacterium]
MMTIKNIIFDFGGVLYDIDFSLMEKAFRDIGVRNIEQVSRQLTAERTFDHLETGAMSPDEFREQIRVTSGINFQDHQIDKAWNALLIGYQNRRMQMLEQVKKHYRIFLLSNSNLIHFWKYQKELQEHYNMTTFDAIFEKPYFSFDIGYRKPKREAFDFVLKSSNLRPDETLFIDDTLEHIQGADKLGIKTKHLDLNAGEEVVNLFDGNGMLKVKF